MWRRRLFALMVGASLAGCAGWGTLNTEDMLADAKERSAATSEAHAFERWQSQTFGPLAELAGATYRGEPLTADGQANPDAAADIQAWSWSADGMEMIIRHALEDGSYGGTTRVYPNGEDGELAYTYITSAAFQTMGTFTLEEDGSWEALEAVEGHAGITQVRSRGMRRSDGALISTSEYFSDGVWTPGHGFVYTEFDGEVPKVTGAPAQ